MTTWKPVLGYEDTYAVSDEPQVRRIATGRILTPNVNAAGYERVTLCREGKGRLTLLHRIVLDAFVGPCPDGMVACHGDGNPGNNVPTNLRWDTPSSNNLDAVKHGTSYPASRTACPKGHPYDAANTYHARNKRFCRRCMADQMAARVAKKLAAAPTVDCPVCGTDMPAITRRGPRLVCSKKCSGIWRNTTATRKEAA